MRKNWGKGTKAYENGQEEARAIGEPGLLILDLLHDGVEEIHRWVDNSRGGPQKAIQIRLWG